jgi:hypothetical protein
VAKYFTDGAFVHVLRRPFEAAVPVTFHSEEDQVVTSETPINIHADGRKRKIFDTSLAQDSLKVRTAYSYPVYSVLTVFFSFPKGGQ